MWLSTLSEMICWRHLLSSSSLSTPGLYAPQKHRSCQSCLWLYLYKWDPCLARNKPSDISRMGEWIHFLLLRLFSHPALWGCADMRLNDSPFPAIIWLPPCPPPHIHAGPLGFLPCLMPLLLFRMGPSHTFSEESCLQSLQSPTGMWSLRAGPARMGFLVHWHSINLYQVPLSVPPTLSCAEQRKWACRRGVL